MKKSVLIAVLCALAVMAMAGPACADRGWGRGGGGDRADRGGFGRAENFEERQAFRMERRERMQEMRREEMGRDGPPAFGRMSPEERRQLRHDIRSAREGIYRRPPPPPPHFPPGYGTP